MITKLELHQAIPHTKTISGYEDYIFKIEYTFGAFNLMPAGNTILQQFVLTEEYPDPTDTSYNEDNPFIPLSDWTREKVEELFNLAYNSNNWEQICNERFEQIISEIPPETVQTKSFSF